MNEVLQNDIKNFYEFVRQSETKWMHENQEIVLTCLSLLLNKTFYKLVSELRIKHQVPSTWFTNSPLNNPYEDDWLKFESTGKALNEYDDVFSNICTKCGVDPAIYNYFVFGYFYFSDVKIDISAIDFPNITSSPEYKCGIEIIKTSKPGFFDKLSHKDTGTKAYIRFYKDTTPNQLIEFIRKNKQLIKFIQNDYADSPLPYPHGKKYGSFKRDLQIYLLSLQGKKSPEIGSIIYDMSVPKDEANPNFTQLENLYSLTDSAIRQIIKDVNARIHIYTKGSFKV